MKARHRYDGVSVLVVLSLIVLDLFLWHDIFSYGLPKSVTRAYFLNAGRTSAELIIFPDNVKILIDAGADQTVMNGLEKILPINDTYIDLAVLSDAEANRSNGYVTALNHYRIGAFIYNGRDTQILSTIKEKGIPMITLGAEDTIRYGDDEIDILSPDKNFIHSPAPADTAFVALIKTPNFKILSSADAGANVLSLLLRQNKDLRADILSASGTVFLKAVDPKFAITRVPSGTEVFSHP